MLYEESRSAYSNAAASGASEADLLQLIYARLAQDCLRAATAARLNDIQSRCDACNHAFLLLGHVESWTFVMQEKSLAESLRGFYDTLRHSLFAAQASSDAGALEACATLILDTKAVWQRMQMQVLTAARSTEAPISGSASLSFEA